MSAATTPQPAEATKPKAKEKEKAGRTKKNAVDPNQAFRDAMRDLIAERWGALWNVVPVAIAGEDIEGVHDVRVASRRLRAAMDVATDCFPTEWYRSLHQTAKAITAALGEVRDRDVLIDALTAERERVPEVERPGLDRLIARIERERAEARADMERFLRGLGERGVAADVVRRFGLLAAAPEDGAVEATAGG